MPVPCCFDDYGFVVSFDSRQHDSSALFFSLKIAVSIQGLSLFHINFWSICSSSMKYGIGILIGIVLNP